jgi:hypothetical protein
MTFSHMLMAKPKKDIVAMEGMAQVDQGDIRE